MLTLLVVSLNAHAYDTLIHEGEDCDDAGIVWEQHPVPFYINTDGDHGLDAEEVEAAIVKAARAWEGHGSDFAFEYQGITKNGVDMTDGMFVVSFPSSWDTSAAGAVALTRHYTSGCKLIHVDILINSIDYDLTVSGEAGSYDIENFMVHEFGHALGLDHSEDGAASMFAHVEPDETLKRDLHEDDIDGLVSIYPQDGTASNSDEGTTDAPTGSNSGAGSSGNRPDNASSGSNSLAPIEGSGCSTAGATTGLGTVFMSMLVSILLGSRRRE